MPNAKFVLKEPTSKESTLVYLMYAYDYKRLKYSTGEKIKPKYWNENVQRAKESKLYPENSEFNTRLKNIGMHINNAYRKLINDGIIPTNDKLKIELDHALDKLQKKKQLKFTDFIKQVIDDSNKRPNTIKNYKQTLKQLKENVSCKKHFWC